MRTLKQLKEYFKANGIRNEAEDGGEYYEFTLGGEYVKNDEWYRSGYYSGGETLSCCVSQSTYCCGIMEMGQFSLPNKYPKHWEAILEFVLRKEKLKYLRTETITSKSNPHKALDAALKAVGFRLVTTVPSGHNRDNPKNKHYNIKVWEWLKK